MNFTSQYKHIDLHILTEVYRTEKNIKFKGCFDKILLPKIYQVAQSIKEVKEYYEHDNTTNCINNVLKDVMDLMSKNVGMIEDLKYSVILATEYFNKNGIHQDILIENLLKSTEIEKLLVAFLQYIDIFPNKITKKAILYTTDMLVKAECFTEILNYKLLELLQDQNEVTGVINQLNKLTNVCMNKNE